MPPISNGKIGRDDIRRGAIRADHIGDGQIGTEKLRDVSILIENIADARYAANFQANPAAGATFTTTFTTITSAGVAIPTWVGMASITATARIEMTNSSGGTQKLMARILIAGTGGTHAQTSIRDGDTATLVETDTVDLLDLWSDSDVPTRRNIIQAVVDSVIVSRGVQGRRTVDPDRLRITWKV